jgi:sugar phosphate isomerase/epimerase
MTLDSGRWELSFSMPLVRYTFQPAKSFRFEGEAARRKLEVLRQAGIRWIMIDGINPLDDAGGQIEEIVRTTAPWFEEFGMRVSSFHTAAPYYNRLDRSQEPVVRNLLENVRLFAPWRPKAFVLHAGTMWCEQEDFDTLPDSMFRHGECDRMMHMHKQEVDKNGEQAVIATVAANMKVFARESAKHGIALACENMGDMTALGGFDSLGKLVAAVDEPTFGYCLDSGHAWMRGEDPVDWIRFAGKKLFTTHLHDNRGGSKSGPALFEQDEHLSPGFGTIDWRRIIGALDEVGFPGPVNFETEGWPIGDPLEGYRLAMQYWRVCEKMALKA